MGRKTLVYQGVAEIDAGSKVLGESLEVCVHPWWTEGGKQRGLWRGSVRIERGDGLKQQ